MRIAGKLHMCERINNSCLIHQQTSLDLQINPNSYVKVLYDLTFQKKKALYDPQWQYFYHFENMQQWQYFPIILKLSLSREKLEKSGNNLSSQWHKGSPLTWI